MNCCYAVSLETDKKLDKINSIHLKLNSFLLGRYRDLIKLHHWQSSWNANFKKAFLKSNKLAKEVAGHLSF